MSHYTTAINSLRSNAIATARELGHSYIFGRVFAECCLNAVARSGFGTALTLEDAKWDAAELVGDFDLSTTRYYRFEDAEIERGDPTLERALAELVELGQITLGDFVVRLEKI